MTTLLEVKLMSNHVVSSEDILTTKEVGDLLSRILQDPWDWQKVCRWVREKRLPLLRRAGSAMLFSRAEIVEWAADYKAEM
jgi:hypothetical protein